MIKKGCFEGKGSGGVAEVNKGVNQWTKRVVTAWTR